jgi:hypothetical protein
VRGILFPQINFLPPLPLFPRRLPRVLQCRPQFVSPCRELENPGRSFGTGCRESGFRCRSLGNPAANLNPAAAFLKTFAANFSAFARNLTGLAANLPAMKLKGWTDAETATFTTVRGTFPASTTTQQSGQSDAKKATGVKATDAADAYEHILTIQNAADLEFSATDPANAPVRAEFKLGIFPPDHHAPPATPTPTPASPPAK